MPTAQITNEQAPVPEAVRLMGAACVAALAACVAALAACVAALAACVWTATPAWAQGPTGATMHPSLLPNRLGARTALTLAFRFSGGQEGVPAPLRAMVLRLPAGLRVDLRGVATCARARLLRGGARACPSRSLVGRGHALLAMRAGSQTLPEESTIRVFRGPNQGSHPTLEIFARGDTPLYQSSTSTAVLAPDAAPFGTRLAVSVPPIPTLVHQPDASFLSLSLTVGLAGRNPRAHTAGAIVLGRSCPAGGFPFAAAFTFADRSTASATATVACP